MTIKNGHMPAMPTPFMDVTNGSGELYCDQQGLTKLEEFAARALWSGDCPYNKQETVNRVEWALNEAKALLAALEGE
jgi:hypothetical protein